MKPPELKPCPFCGSTNIKTPYGEEGWTCMKCGSNGYWNWNTRPIEDKLQAEIERLKSERRWIPVSEPPKKNGYFWCSIVDDAGCKWVDKRLFSVENGWFTIGEQVTHWMPLPQPPSEEEC